MFHAKKTFRSPCMSGYVETETCKVSQIKETCKVSQIKETCKVSQIKEGSPQTQKNKKPKFLPGERLLKEVGLKQQALMPKQQNTSDLETFKVSQIQDFNLDMYKKSITEVIRRLSLG